MQKIINHLIQLQELTVARAQQEASMPGAQLQGLDESIKTLFGELPPEVASQFSRIQKRDANAFVPIANGVCTACAISLPVSLVNSVRAAETLYQCPNCARLLFYPTTSLRVETKRTPRGEPPKVGIARFSSEALMVPKLSADNRDDCIAELSGLLEEKGFVKDASKLAEKALLREAIVSTAVDHGLAFPHVRGVEGGGLTMALGIRKRGLKFDGPSRHLTRIIFFMVIPTAASAFYLKLLSGLTQTFRETAAREKLLEADTPESLWKTLAKLTKNTVT
jgi:mannitol/fructose-specific phosphotransferase system IIA component (Ntr-type)